MPTIAPWLHLPDFVGAMSSGAAAGLGVRHANQQATESADRLQLAYDQLAANEEREGQEMRAKMKLADASLALRGQQMDAMRAYHEGQLTAREENMDRLHSQFQDREARMGNQFQDTASRLGDQFNTRMDNAEKNQNARAAAADAIQRRFEANQARLERNASGAGPGRLSPSDYFQAKADSNELDRVQKSIDKIEEAGGPGRAGFLWMKEGTTKIYPALKAKEAELRDKLKGYRTPREQAANTLNANSPTAEEDYMMGPQGGGDESPADYAWNPETRRIEKIAQ